MHENDRPKFPGQLEGVKPAPGEKRPIAEDQRPPVVGDLPSRPQGEAAPGQVPERRPPGEEPGKRTGGDPYTDQPPVEGP